MDTRLGTINLILSALAIIAGGYCLWQIYSLNRLRKTFFAGTKGLDLESVIHILEQELKDSRASQAVLEQALTELKSQLGLAVQKVGVVRFNPFGDSGGNFSFSLALLNEHNSGVVITSMYGREQNRIYTKSLENGKSEAQLTLEEQQAVSNADGKFPTLKPNELKKPKRKSNY